MRGFARKPRYDERLYPTRPRLYESLLTIPIMLFFGAVVSFFTWFGLIVVVGLIDLLPGVSTVDWLKAQVVNHPTLSLAVGWVLLNAVGLACVVAADEPFEEFQRYEMRLLRRRQEQGGHEAQGE